MFYILVAINESINELRRSMAIQGRIQDFHLGGGGDKRLCAHMYIYQRYI